MHVYKSYCMYVCYAALPQPPADFFNLGVANPASVPSSSASSDSAMPAQPPPAAVSRYGMPPVPMFRHPVGMIPPHLPLGPGGPRRPPPPPPRMGGPPPGRPFPPGMYDGFIGCIDASRLSCLSARSGTAAKVSHECLEQF